MFVLMKHIPHDTPTVWRNTSFVVKFKERKESSPVL